ncbi:Pyrroloquinoline quinone biosynthesis protein PqqC [Hyella patelloides LEGE 07179]|uniref:Pyrroloquinoline quinone biosynthesis protein PqqC n=1 Tax=Hyella patelloides LEGE 07179 TaxID=945734 RepID=A0A563W4Y1_9CYAN|nr:iron-containing redox enzyme family protein [Hyella patelloides]VEP18762.1 Pyrroloquinoline quinone biosynthesis protein PqqC [Hyella patelloides LEGE 07179]
MLPTKDYKQPLFKEQVFFQFKETSVEITYGTQECSLSFEPENQPQTIQLLKLLQTGNVSLQQLGQACPEIEEQIPELLIEFERLGMIQETQDQILTQPMTGLQFYRELRRFLQHWQNHIVHPLAFKKMTEGTITREQLVGYALESYHVTHLCPRLLAASLTKQETPHTYQLLQEFFVSELHHDRLIESSLASVGIEESQLEQMQPLPMTFAICSALAVFAQQHPLSFKVALWLFEQDDPKFLELFKQCCQDLDLPREFYQPILLHANINDEGEHEQITKNLLAEVAYISAEEQLRVKKNIAILQESIMLRDRQIIDYYGNPHNIIPRCFS